MDDVTGELRRVQVSSSGRLLVSASGAIGAGSIACRVYKSSPETISADTPTALTFDTEDYDTDSIFSAGNPTRLTANTAGKYLIQGQVDVDNAAGSNSNISILLNGTDTIAQWGGKAFSAVGFNSILQIHEVFALSVNDYVEFVVHFADELDAGAGQGTTWFAMTRQADQGGAGTGDVVGPSSSTDNAIARFDSTTGKLIQNSVVTIADTTGAIAGTQSVTIGVAGSATGTLLLKGTTSGTVTIKTADAAGTYTLTLPTDDGTPNQVLSTDGSGVLSWATPASGTVTAVSVASANGFAGSSSGGATPQLTLSTTVTGILSGNGTALSAATTTGSGDVVLATSPTLVTPVLGVATATSINKVALTAPATGSTLTIADGKTLTVSDSMTLAGPNGSGNVVFTTSPTLVTPVLGVATATSINKVAITAPASSATLTIADGKTLTASNSITIAGTDAKTLTVSNSITLAGTDSTVMTFPSTSATIARTDAGQTFTGVQAMTSPDITTSLTTPSTTFSLVNATATTVNFAGAATTMAVGASTALITVAGNTIHSSNAITASGNAATVPITHRLSTVTNNSAATLTITITTTSAVDGQLIMVRVLDASAAAQTITWVNTENSTVTAPTTSNGSTTLPLTVGFQYNNATSKWRCIAKA